jgi:multimeric flavodoxin WrbA
VKILAIDGSPKKGKVTRLLKESLVAASSEGARHFKENVSVEMIRIADLNIRPHNGSLTDIPDELAAAFEKMREADGFIFGTPVHWYNMSSQMKCFIDWLTSVEYKCVTDNKVFGVIAHCNDDGGNQAAMSIIAPLLHMAAILCPSGAFYRNPHVAEHSQDRWQMTDQRLIGQNVVRMIIACRSNPRGWFLTTD